MSNQDREIGLRYLQATYYGLPELFAEGQGEEGMPGEPLKFKVYRGVPHYPLNQRLPLSLGDLRRALVSQGQDTHRRVGPRSLDDQILSCLLYYSYGFSRHDSGLDARWPFHRLVASARCFFPAELYAWLPAAEPVPSGFYHYDNLHHSLAALRQGDYRAVLSAALGCELTDSLGVLFVSAYFWKNAFRYRNFSYRLCSQEVGMVVGNILLVCGVLGIAARVHYQFLDRVLIHLLGLEDGEESPFAAVVLSPAESERQVTKTLPAPAISAEALLKGIEPIAPAHIKLSALDRERCQKLLEIDQHSRLESSAELAVLLPPATPSCDQSLPTLEAPAPWPEELELVQALYQRSSGDVFFLPLYRPVSRVAFWEIVRYSLAPYASDLGGVDRRRPALELFLALNNVADVPAGIYRLCGSCGALHVVEQRAVAAQIQAIHSTPAVNCGSAPFVAYPVASYGTLSAALGNRAYRIMNMECGLVAQRLSVLSAAFGLVARCSDSYHLDRCAELLHLRERVETPLFLIAFGYERPGAGAGARYRHSIRL
ncbi:MAG: SagB family peptide dehydrogenase [Thermogemmatispora sp.]|jgi:SagB-type dehydrogenase family enzyme|uniref:SagB family peptide dehydrogenase n=1 Tax=Thermogemmatispora sp. TaxID=1968838 RepID=UPI0019DF66A0|nr:SagB family peptide dehydrogenase [Thermogemmatispora sp.]MBE3565392.1 SagB family peptide dehydrogenase [Thermogemmatispora sp.]